MTVKFVVTDKRVIFGSIDYNYDSHSSVAQQNGIPLSSVRGGGIADLAGKRILGTSYGFGPYNPDIVRSFLTGWQVDQPADY